MRPTAQAKGHEPLADQLAPLLARQHDKVQQAAIGLTRLSAPERHQLRIEVKRLRYLLDIALPLWPQAASSDYRKALESLQERLGTLNDLSEAGLQLAAQGAAPVLCELWAEHERSRLDADLPRVVKQLAGARSGRGALGAQRQAIEHLAGGRRSLNNSSPTRLFPMQTIRLGTSDLEVTPVCLGTMTFGEQVDEATSHAVLDRSLGSGVNFIDTSEMYSVPTRAATFGATETIIGNWFAKNPGARQATDPREQGRRPVARHGLGA